MISGARIRERLEAIGASQRALAKAINVTPQAVSKIVNSDTANSAYLYQIARFLGTTPEYLSCETDNPEGTLPPLGSEPASFEELAADRGLIPIRHLDLAFGMGATYLDNPVEEEMRFFPEEFIKAFTNAPPEMVFFAEGAGDSMMPTIHSSDLVIVDTSSRRMTMRDQVWACSMAGLGMIKRLRPMPDGGVKILSDNPSVPEETAYDGELTLVGRVVAVVRKL